MIWTAQRLRASTATAPDCSDELPYRSANEAPTACLIVSNVEPQPPS